MAVSELLRLVVEADTRGAVQGMEKVGSTAQRELSRSQQNLDRWGNRLTTVGAGMVAFGTVAAYGLARAGQAAGDLEQAVGGTEAVFGSASGKIDEYGRAAAKNAGLSETEFRIATTQIGGNLKRMGFDVDEAADKSVDLTQVAADLAATYGGTTAEAVQALGAAFRGEADPAERFNLDLKVSKVNAEAVALGLATSTSAVDDHARAQALLSLIMKQSADAQGQYGRESDTLAGRQQTLAAEFENLKASIGEGAMPIMEDLFGIAEGGIGVFQGLDDATGGFVGKAATIGTVATLGLGGLSLLVGQAIKMRDNFALARDAVGRFNTRIGGVGRAARVAAGAAGVVGLVFAVKELGDALENSFNPTKTADVNRLENALLDLGQTGRITGELLAIAGEDMGDLAGAFDRVGDPGNFDRVRDAVHTMATLGDDTKDLENARQKIDDLDSALSQLAARDPDEAAAVFDALTVELERQGVPAERVKDLLDEYGSTVAGIETDDAVTGTEELGGAMDNTAGSTGDATSALQNYADTLRAQFDPLFAYQDAVTANKEALDEEAAAQAELDLLRASGNATAEELKAAEDRLAAAHGDVQSSAVGLAGKEAELMGQLLDGSITADQMRAELDRLEAQGYLSAAAANDLRRKIDAVEGKKVELGVTGYHDSLNRIHGVIAAINGIPARRFVNISVGLDRSEQELLAMGARPRAHGGPVAGGRLYEVAEQGRAELLEMGGRTYLIPGSSGTVIPADAMAAPTAGMGGAGGATTNIINLNGPIGSEAEAARWVGRALKAAGQSGQSLTVNGRRVA